MTDCRFQVARLRERFPEWRIEKDRVVAKPSVALRLAGDLPLHRALRFEEDVATAGQRERANKARGAVNCAFRAKLVVDERELLRIGRVRTAPSGGFDARRAAQR